MICALIMSHRGPIKDDPARLGKLCLISRRRVEKILTGLVDKSKIERVSSEIRQKTAEESVENAQKIMEIYQNNGSSGGRTSNKNSGLAKPSGCVNLNQKPNLNNQEGDFLKNGGKRNGVGGLHLTTDEIEEAKKVAPGWDIYRLEAQWREFNRGREGGILDPGAAFKGFAKNFARNNRL